MGVPHYWKVEQVGRLLDALAAHNRHQARTLALIMWRTGLRISEALALEWRDVDYRGEVPTLIVRESKSGKPRTVPFPLAGAAPVTGSCRSARHADSAAACWRRHPVGRPRRGITRNWEATCRRSQPAALGRSALADGGPCSAERGEQLAGPRQRAGHAKDLPADRGQHLLDGGRAVARAGERHG